MSLAHPTPSQTRFPDVTVLPDGRGRYTRFYDLTLANQIKLALFTQLAPGAVDPHPLFAGARFTYEQTIAGAPQGVRSYLTRTFEVLPATAEVQVGLNTKIKLEDGRTGIEAEFWQFSAGTATPGIVGTTTAPGDTSAFLTKEVAENDGTLRRIKRTYVYAGTLAQTDETREGGMALTRTIVSAKTVPDTPAGYTLIVERKEPVNGFPVYTYTFAKGLGLVFVGISSRSDGLREVTNISLGTRTAPSGIVIRDDYRESDGYKIYTVTALQTAAGGADVTTATVVFDAYVGFTYPGRAKPFVHLGDPDVPCIEVFKSPPIQTQVKALVTTSYQTSNAFGAISDYWNPTDWATLRAEFKIPSSSGDPEQKLIVQALPYYRGVSSPLTVAIDAAPYFIAKVFGEITFGMVVETGSLVTTPYDVVITINGGPPDPGGNTWTLDARLDLAFTATDGTKYYRKTLVTAAIPAQSALPV